MVARTERLELLEDPEELRSDLREIQTCIHLHHRSLSPRTQPVSLADMQYMH